MTGCRAFEEEIDPGIENPRILHELPVPHIPEDDSWIDLLEVLEDGPEIEDAIARAAAVNDLGPVDLDLLGHALTLSESEEVHLVSNDEDLLQTAQILLKSAADPLKFQLLPVDSLTFIKNMYFCGAFDLGITKTILDAEYQDVSARPMGTSKRRRKLRRVRTLARNLSIDIDEGVDEAVIDETELREVFLREAGDQDGS